MDVLDKKRLQLHLILPQPHADIGTVHSPQLRHANSMILTIAGMVADPVAFLCASPDLQISMRLTMMCDFCEADALKRLQTKS